MKTHGTLQWAEERPGGRTGGVFFIVAAPYVMVRAKRLLPRATPYRERGVLIVDTPEVARDIEWLCDRYPLEASDATLERLRARSADHRAREEEVVRILAGERLTLDLRAAACEDRDYQRIAAEVIMRTGRLLLVDDLGLGKSITGLLALRHPAALPAVVVCYPHLMRQWQHEISFALPWLSSHIVTQMQPYDPARRRGSRGVRPDVLVVPWSKLRGWGDHLAGDARSVIFDEVQELRLPGSQKYVAAAQVADAAAFRVGLTTTPVYNYGGEIWSVMNVIAPDVLGSRHEFGQEWCGGGDASGRKVRVKDPASLGLYLRDQGVYLRRTRQEVGRELPPVHRVPLAVDCDADLLDRLSGDVVLLADLILRRETSTADRFKASGELDWKLRRATGLAKAPYVADFVRMLLDSEDKIVLFGWHRDVYEQWRHRLADLEPLFYTGTESPKLKHENVERFVNGDSRVLIVSLRAGAGLDGLQHACKTCVFGELDWSPGMHDQCIGRFHREGMGDDPVTAYFLYSEEGSDPVVIDVLNVKRSQSEPMRDPNASPLAAAEGTEDRIKTLAADVIRRYRARRK